MKVAFKTNLDAFNLALGDYLKVTKLSTQEAVQKNSADFAFRLSKALSEYTPKKGVIRSERLLAFRSGQGIKIRPAIYEQVAKKYGLVSDLTSKRSGFIRRKKFTGMLSTGTKKTGKRRLNYQALAARAELNLRESGRGFLSYSSRMKSIVNELAIQDDVDQYKRLLDKYNRFLASVGFKTDADSAGITFSWGGSASSDQAARALQKPRQQRTIAAALDASRANMMEYIIKRQARAKSKLATI